MDVVVLDSAGHPVLGLARDDFRVEEDGKLRDIASFEAFVLGPLPAAPAAASPVASNAAPPSDAGRAFALIIDDTSMGRITDAGLMDSYAQDTHRLVSTVLNSSLHDGDEVILATASRHEWWTARLPEGREDLLAVAGRIRGRWSDVCPGGGGAPSLGSAATMDGGTECVDRRAALALAAVRRGVEALAPIHGRKSVLLFSPGFLQDSDTSMGVRRVAAVAREANAAVYFIDVRGLLTSTSLAVTELASGAAQDLADETGGFSIRRTNGLAAGAEQIVDESRAYYLLGFHPAARGPRDEWRKLHVSLKQKGLQVRARRGYTLRGSANREVATPKAATSPRQGPDPAVLQAFDSPHERRGIPVRAMAYVFEPQPKRLTHVVVAVELDADKLAFDHKGRGRVAHVDVAVMARNRDTGQDFERDDTVAIQAEGSEPAGWRSLAREFGLPAGVTLARVFVRDSATGVSGSVSQRFEIPPPGTLHVSTPIITDHLANVEKAHGHPQPALAVHRDFAPGGKLCLQFEVFGAARPPGNGLPQVVAGLELRTSSGQVVLKTEPTPITADLSGRLIRMAGMSLDGMDEGLYDLVLDVRDRVGGGRLERHEPFTLARKAISP